MTLSEILEKRGNDLALIVGNGIRLAGGAGGNSWRDFCCNLPMRAASIWPIGQTASPTSNSSTFWPCAKRAASPRWPSVSAMQWAIGR